MIHILMNFLEIRKNQNMRKLVMKFLYLLLLLMRPPPTIKSAQVQQNDKETITSNVNIKQEAPSDDYFNKDTNSTIFHNPTKYDCEKCQKGFTSMILLRHHYCNHFQKILNKRYAHLCSENKCLECSKTFSNLGRFLLHIGAEHDKINEILKDRGYKTLPPSGGSKLTEPAIQSSSTNNDMYKETDVKPVPLIKDSAKTNENASATNTMINEKKKPFSTGLSINGSNTAKNVSSAADCNYELECQVCQQKLKNETLLEQHCCRHFQKELQDQYGSLMDGLRCVVCNSSFKQKASLLIHIGGKHGKINDILRQKNYAPLPCPVTNTYSAKMQKQLEQIKKEKFDVSDSGTSLSSAVKETGDESSVTLSEMDSEAGTSMQRPIPDIPKQQSLGPSPTIEDILKKYKL